MGKRGKKENRERKLSIYKHYIYSQNMALTGRFFGVSREYVRQVVNQIQRELEAKRRKKLDK